MDIYAYNRATTKQRHEVKPTTRTEYNLVEWKDHTIQVEETRISQEEFERLKKSAYVTTNK